MEAVESGAREVAVLEALLPQQMTAEELRSAVEALVAEGADQIGAVMKGLGQRYSGRYDGKAASAVAREVLASG